MAVNVLVVSGYGTNSQLETAHAARLAGADTADIAHFADLIDGECRLEDYQFLIFPGGFLDGDRLGAGQAAAVRWRFLKTLAGVPLPALLRQFIDKGGLILGICNGFQLLLKLGLLPALEGAYFERSASLGHNDSGKFEDRWVYLKCNSASPCVFTKGLQRLYLPVRHGEGRFVAGEKIIDKLERDNQIALSYEDPQTGEITEAYPFNPNGSPRGIAGICDPSGRILGLMPHPEAFHHVTNHPGWTRGDLDPPGTLLFVNAVRYLRAEAKANAPVN